MPPPLYTQWPVCINYACIIWNTDVVRALKYSTLLPVRTGGCAIAPLRAHCDRINIYGHCIYRGCPAVEPLYIRTPLKYNHTSIHDSLCCPKHKYYVYISNFSATRVSRVERFAVLMQWVICIYWSFCIHGVAVISGNSVPDTFVARCIYYCICWSICCKKTIIPLKWSLQNFLNIFTGI